MQELVDAGKVPPNWLTYEEGVANRMVSRTQGGRYEYAAVFKDRDGRLDVLAIEGAKQVGQTITLIDRKLVFVKAGDYTGVMNSLNKVAQFLDQNPGTRLSYEFNPGVIVEELVHLRRAKAMLEDIRTGSSNPELQIYTNNNGVRVVDTEAMTLLRRMIEDGRIDAVNAIERTTFPQNVFEEGSGLSVSELDPAHIYLQLTQARQYWLDQGASLARLNQGTFAIADLPSGWAARTEGTRITLDTNGAGWGWFVDPSPEDNAEFVPLDSAYPEAQGDYTAAPGSEAEGKLDLLTVLIHELGHVLGLPMPQSADGTGSEGAHAMSQYLSPRPTPPARRSGHRRAASLGAGSLLGQYNDAYRGYHCAQCTGAGCALISGYSEPCLAQPRVCRQQWLVHQGHGGLRQPGGGVDGIGRGPDPLEPALCAGG